MAAAEDEPLDDADIGDEWERMERLAGALQLIAQDQNIEQVTPARQLLQSLEMRIKEGEDGR